MIDVVGRGGVRIEDVWADGAQAYLGITVAGFPNLFMLYGPNTNQGSILLMLEHEVDYIVRKLEHMRDNDIAWLDVRREVMDDYNEALQRHLIRGRGAADGRHEVLPRRLLSHRSHRHAVAAHDGRVRGEDGAPDEDAFEQHRADRVPETVAG